MGLRTPMGEHGPDIDLNYTPVRFYGCILRVDAIAPAKSANINKLTQQEQS